MRYFQAVLRSALLTSKCRLAVQFLCSCQDNLCRFLAFPDRLIYRKSLIFQKPGQMVGAYLGFERYGVRLPTSRASAARESLAANL